MNFQFSNEARPRVERIGDEQQPLVMFDNALANAESIVEAAAAKSFRPIGAYFPGVRAPAGDEFNQALAEMLKPCLADVFGFDDRYWRCDSFYSLVTTPPQKLLPIQRLPHFDGVEERAMAVLIYLNAHDFGGTAFYRHRSTGFETVNEERYLQFKATLEQEVRDGHMPPARYIEQGEPYFERIKRMEPQFNRMLVYRGVSLHCGAIDNDRPLPQDPRQGRLTLNAFLKPAPQLPF